MKNSGRLEGEMGYALLRHECRNLLPGIKFMPYIESISTLTGTGGVITVTPCLYLIKPPSAKTNESETDDV